MLTFFVFLFFFSFFSCDGACSFIERAIIWPAVINGDFCKARERFKACWGSVSYPLDSYIGLLLLVIWLVFWFLHQIILHCIYLLWNVIFYHALVEQLLILIVYWLQSWLMWVRSKQHYKRYMTWLPRRGTGHGRRPLKESCSNMWNSA